MQTVLYPIAKAILPRLNTCVFSKAENVGLFYDPPGKYPSDTQQCRATGDKMTAVV